MRHLKSLLPFIFTFVLLLTLLQGCVDDQETGNGNPDGQTGSGILIIIPPDEYDPEEIITIKTSLTGAGIEVVTATRGDTNGQGGDGEGGINPDIILTDDTDLGLISEYLGVIFIGGRGAEIYYDDPAIEKIVIIAHENSRVLAAIGIAPLLIVNALPDFIQGKRIACDPSIQDQVTSMGAIPVEDDIAVEGTLVTASGEEQIPLFVKEIVNLLGSSS